MIAGSMVALVTPMDAQGRLDWDALSKLVDFHLQEGTNAIVAVGTTGESATLDVNEHIEVIRHVVKQVAGRIPVIAGTGANSTREAIELTTNASATLSDNRIAGDVLTINNSGVRFADKNAGVNKTVTVGGITLSGADAGNYVVNSSASTTGTITQAALAVNVDNAEKDQGRVNPAFTASYAGLLGGDTLAGEVSGNLAFSTPATTGSVAGDYLVSAAGQTSTNYALTYTPGVLTVKPTEALQSALASALATVNMVPSQGDMVQAEVVATGDSITSKEEAVQVAQADTPVVQVTASAYANALPGLRLNVVDGGVRLPPEAGNTSLESE